LSVGAYLRSVRQAKEGSLKEMARVTRVSASQLEALESDRFSELPAPVFVKGFIRAYCDFLGEPPEDALRRYRDHLGERPAPERPVPARRPARGWSGSPIFVSFTLLVIFGLGLLAVNVWGRRSAKAVFERPAPVAPLAEPSHSMALAPPAVSSTEESA